MARLNINCAGCRRSPRILTKTAISVSSNAPTDTKRIARTRDGISAQRARKTLTAGLDVKYRSFWCDVSLQHPTGRYRPTRTSGNPPLATRWDSGQEQVDFALSPDGISKQGHTLPPQRLQEIANRPTRSAIRQTPSPTPFREHASDASSGLYARTGNTARNRGKY